MGGGRLRDERGAGLLTMLVWLFLIGGVVWLTVSLVPIYTEYWSITQAFQSEVEKSHRYDSKRQLKKMVLEELKFHDLDRLSAADIEVERLRQDGYRVHAEYEEEVRLSTQVSLVFHFQPEAQEGG